MSRKPRIFAALTIGCGVLAYVGGLAISATIPSAGLVSIAAASAFLIAAIATALS